MSTEPNVRTAEEKQLDDLAHLIMTAALASSLGITVPQAKSRYTKNMPVGEFWKEVAAEVQEHQIPLVNLARKLSSTIQEVCITPEELRQHADAAGL